MFEVPGGYAIPVVFGGGQKAVRIRLRNLEGHMSNPFCKALHPGSEEWIPVPVLILRIFFRMNRCITDALP